MKASLRRTRLWDVCLWMAGRYHRCRIVGNSMVPLLRPDNEVLIDPAAFAKVAPAVGDIVITGHPQHPELPIIKRIEQIEPDGRCHLRGDNADASSDSRQFGPVATDTLKGKVVCRFP